MPTYTSRRVDFALGVLAAGLLSVATYGLAELLGYRITQPQIFGTLIPAIGATPYALCGAIYPLATLPTGQTISPTHSPGLTPSQSCDTA